MDVFSEFLRTTGFMSFTWGNALMVLIGVFIFVRMPVSESFLFAHAPRRYRATLLGAYFLGSSAGGGVFTPFIGWLSDRHDFRYSFAVVALALVILTVLCGVLLLGLRKELKSSEEQQFSE